MKKFYVATIAAVLLSLSCLAQPILNRSDIEPSIGESFIASGFDWDATAPSIGANQTWDYSGVNLTNSGSLVYRPCHCRRWE